MRTYVILSLAFLAGLGCQRSAGQQSPAAAAELLPNQKSPAAETLSGGQPSAEQLAASRDAGYRTVINLRTADEKTSIENEADLVAELGMDYVTLPIAGASGLTRDNVDAFALALETAEYPVLIHCGSGNRIGAMFALKAFYLDGKNAEEALQIGRDSGLTQLEGAVKEILEAETSAPPVTPEEGDLDAAAA